MPDCKGRTLVDVQGCFGVVWATLSLVLHKSERASAGLHLALSLSQSQAGGRHSLAVFHTSSFCAPSPSGTCATTNPRGVFWRQTHLHDTRSGSTRENSGPPRRINTLRLGRTITTTNQANHCTSPTSSPTTPHSLVYYNHRATSLNALDNPRRPFTATSRHVM